jgi:hypothetical protein
MGKLSLDSFLEHIHIDPRLQNRIRNTFLAYATAYAAACGNGPTGIKPPPPPVVGAPSIVIEPSPNSGMAPLTSNVCVTVTKGANGGTIKDAWADYNGNGTRDADETLSAGQTCKPQTYMSTKTLTGIVTGGDNQTGQDLKTVTVIQPVIVDTLAGIIYAIDSVTGLKGAPIAGANVALASQLETTTTGADGSYKLPLRKMKSQLVNADTLVISKDDADPNKKFQTYRTFLAYTLNADKTKGDFALIPSNIIESINYYLRQGYDAGFNVRPDPLKNWEMQPQYYINENSFPAVLDGLTRQDRVRFLEDWLMSDKIEKFTKGFLKRAVSRDAISKITSDPIGSDLDGKWVFSYGGGVKEAVCNSNNLYKIRGVNVGTSASDTNLETEYNTTHESGRAVSYKSPKPNTEEFQSSIMGVGRQFTLDFLRAINISYSEIRPAGSMVPDNDKAPVSVASSGVAACQNN